MYKVNCWSCWQSKEKGVSNHSTLQNQIVSYGNCVNVYHHPLSQDIVGSITGKLLFILINQRDKWSWALKSIDLAKSAKWPRIS